MADTKENKPTSANVTWLGDGSDAESSEWNGTHFKKGEAVEVKDQAMIETAKANRFYKVDGHDGETVEDKPEPTILEGRVDDLPENAAFAPQEVLTARRQESIQKQEQDAEKEKDGTSNKRPSDNKFERGGSRTFEERHPPKNVNKVTPVTPDRNKSEYR